MLRVKFNMLCGRILLVGLSCPPAGDEEEKEGIAGDSDCITNSKAPRRKTALAASAAIAHAIVSYTDDAEDVPLPPPLEAEFSWDPSYEGQGMVNPGMAGSEDYSASMAHKDACKAVVVNIKKRKVNAPEGGGGHLRRGAARQGSFSQVCRVRYAIQVMPSVWIFCLMRCQ